MSSDSSVPSRRQRGRPSAAGKADLEARLFLVGSRLFYEYGYGATTMSAVAKAAPVSKKTLRTRFPSKADFFRAIVAHQISGWETAVDDAPIGDGDTLEKTLRNYGDILVRAGMSSDFIQLQRLMYSESERFPELGEIGSMRFAASIETLAARIEIFAQRDGVPCRNATGAAEMFLMLLMGWNSVITLSNRTISATEREEYLEKMVGIFLGSRPSW